jgi:hypothetical protein
MSTLSGIQPARTGTGAHFDVPALQALFARLAAAWKACQQARAQHRLNGHFHRLRDEHERFLASATDHYDLERLERAWERRHNDPSRAW